MSDRQRLADYLRHMADAARKTGSYIEGMEKADFLADERTQQAVILNLVIIGEAATRLLQSHVDFLDCYPDVPWKSMKGMRNRIAHGYSTSISSLSGRRHERHCPHCSLTSRQSLWQRRASHEHYSPRTARHLVHAAFRLLST